MESGWVRPTSQGAAPSIKLHSRIRAIALSALLLAPTVCTAAPSNRIVKALATAADASAPEDQRVASIRRLGRADYDDVSVTLFKLLAANESEAIRLAVLKTLTQQAEPGSVPPLLKLWNEFPPAINLAALHAITTRQVLAAEFLKQLESGALPLASIDTATRKRFESLPDKQLAKRAQKLFRRAPVLDAKAKFEKFKGALKLKGNPKRGREVFRQRACFNCHRLGGEGVFVGADLFTVKDMPPDKLLLQIVAPNLFFMPNFQLFVAVDEDNELVEGLMAGSNSTTVTLRRAKGDQTVLHKKDLKKLKGIGVSLMPEGLLEQLTDQQIANLLSFIRTSKGSEGVGVGLRAAPTE